MINKLVMTFFALLAFQLAHAQKYSVSGTIKDAGTGEDLIGANVLVKELPGTGASTNVYGFYSLTLPKGQYTLIFQYIGYEPIEKSIDLNDNKKISLELKEASSQLQEVVITATKEDENVTSTDMGALKLSPKEIESIPVLFGEKDILKTVQLMPGVQTAGEGSTGFYVRGGSADQNLILLDGAPVYNASHLLGFFSVFNSDALKDINLIKGNMPAEYGGRLSSVMDVKMKDGNAKKLSVSGGLGLISSRLTVEAPIVKDKGSFMISGRRTYADLFLQLSNDQDLNSTTMYFYDLNMKANYKLGDKDRVYLSGYFGKDVSAFSDSFGFDWGNATGTFRWNHLFNDKLFVNTSLLYSKYNYDIEITGSKNLNINSNIVDWNLKQDYEYYLNSKNTIKFGFNTIYHTFSPGELKADASSGINSSKVEERYGLESALYLSNETAFNSRFKLNYGLRLSHFAALGAGTVYQYNKEGNPISSQYYGKNEVIKQYMGLEPRVSGTYLINESSSLKAGYARSNQYIHLLSNSTSSNPTDIWIPSSQNVQPQISDQFSVGYFKNLHENKYEFSTEVYYKSMQNVIDYKNGAEPNLNTHYEADLLFGDGEAYGAEFFLKKKKGRFTGWMSYTLSKSTKQIEGINNGLAYSAKQDRTHDFSIVGMYKIKPNMTLSANWVYYTGNAVTFPSGKYEIENKIVNLYTERNGYRMPDYHRLDLGLTIENPNFKWSVNPETGEKEKVMKRFSSSWNFSIYNAYGRENAYSIDFKESENVPGTTEAVQLSLFKIIPSITYNFKF